jgi:hypothetical protein
MAVGIKVPKKKPRNQVRRKDGDVDIPSFEGCETWTGERFNRARRHAHQEIYSNVKPADMMPSVWTYMKKNGYTAAQIAAVKSAPHVPVQVGIYTRLLAMGMPDLHQAHKEYWEGLNGTSGEMYPVSQYINQQIELAIQAGAPLVEAKRIEDKKAANSPAAYKPSIQDVMRDAAVRMAEGIDQIVDEFIENPSVEVVRGFEPLSILRISEAKANHARIIRKFYEGAHAELFAVNNPPTAAQLKKLSDFEQDQIAQLKEGYSHYDAVTKKAALELYKKIIDACDIVIGEQKLTKKPRKVKAKSPDDLVKKLKFKSSDSTYGITSVPASGLIGGLLAVVFNTKNRKLGVYVANDNDGFGVKGTGLTNYNEHQSVQKTLRKPAEALAIFKRTTKAKTVREFEAIKTTDIKLNGRFNEDTIILAIFK